MAKGLVTINTDASFVRSEKAGSYAFWISCEAGRFKASGVFKDPVSSSHVAEFRCIINALYYLGTLKVGEIKRLIINTDSLGCIFLLRGHQAAIRKYDLAKWGEPLRLKFFKIKATIGLAAIKIEYRHVKAHVDTSTKRSWVNDWCDKEAKRVLKEFIQKRREKNANV